MAKIVNIYKETLPDLKLVGKVYTDKDCNENGTFSDCWKEWFQNHWFDRIKKIGTLPGNEDTYLGCMRMNRNQLEYWIGMFCPMRTDIPEDFSCVYIRDGNVGITWLKGHEDYGELYDFHESCIDLMKEKGWKIAKNTWFFERYDSSRFTIPDENGEIILDYGVYLAN